MDKLDFSYVRPLTVKEAAEALCVPGAKVIAGGTDLMIELKERKTSCACLVDITAIDELTAIHVTDKQIEIGAAVPFTEIARHPVIRAEYTALAQAVSKVGSPQIRNRGTIGGNLSTGSSAGDSLCPLTAFGADLVIADQMGRKTVNIADFWDAAVRDGLSTKKLLTQIILPRQLQPMQSVFIKLGRRESLAISRLSLTMAVSLDSNHRIADARAAIGSAGRHAYRVPEAENLLRGKLYTEVDQQRLEYELANAIQKTLGARSTAQYKAQAVKGLCRQAEKSLFFDRS